MNDRRDSIYAVINIGSTSLSGMLATKSPQGRVVPIAAHRVPTAGCVRQGSIHNIEEAAKRIDMLIDTMSATLPEEATISGVYVGLDAALCAPSAMTPSSISVKKVRRHPRAPAHPQGPGQ